jgi:hypothetical protein
MGVLNKADFYYGALLSGLINSGFTPAIFEQEENRRIYSVTADAGDFMIYSKYVSNPLPRQVEDVQLWQFSFSHDEIEKIRHFNDGNKKHYFALICGKKSFKGSEIAMLSLTEAKECLDPNYARDSYRISVKVEKGKHGIRVYGTGRADIVEGKDNTIRVSRDVQSIFTGERVS